VNQYLLLAVGLTVITFFSTSAGGLIAIKLRRDLFLFLAFAAGALIGVTFFDILPGAVLILTDLQLIPQLLDFVMLSVVLGFLYYHVTQRGLAMHSHRRAIHGDDAPASIGYVGATGLTIHSFFDGFGIGTSLQAGLQVGLLIALGVIMHDFSDGLNTVTVMLRSKAKRSHTIGFLLADAGSPILGALVGASFAFPEQLLAFILAFFAGEFLSIGASDLLPEADARGTSWRIILLTIAGVFFVFLLTRLAQF